MGMSGLLDVVFPGCASFESGFLIAKRERVKPLVPCGVERQCVALVPSLIPTDWSTALISRT